VEWSCEGTPELLLRGRVGDGGASGLGACRTWGIESEKAAERGQIVTISPAHSETMVQESGEI